MMQAQSGTMMMGIGLAPALFALVFLAIVFVLAVRILHKAGYSGWWSLIGLVPLVNLIMVWVFAFADWPSLRKQKVPAAPHTTAGGSPPTA